jgi:transmembrane sensor
VTEANEICSKSDPLRDEAIDWVVRLKTSELRETDIEALRCWRNQSRRHEEAFTAALRLWRNLGVAARELADEEVAQTAAERFPSRFLGRRGVLASALGAGIAGYFIVKPPLGMWPSLAEFSADCRTRKGEQRRVVVADDISVQMNTQTSLTIRSMRDGPEITIVSGEAEITKIGRPGTLLHIVAADGRVTVARAKFNARCVDGLVAVTCIEGSIDIEQKGRSVLLMPDHQVSYSSHGLSRPVHVDPHEATSWRSGILIFRDRSLFEVVDEVNRYRPGRIFVTSVELGRRVVNGTFYVGRLDDFIDQVRQLFGARVRSLPGGLTLLS